MLVCVTGPIGAGKSTLIRGLGRALDWGTHREDVTQNPIYTQVGQNPARWAFESELGFVLASCEDWALARDHQRSALLERCPLDNAEVFAASRLAHAEITEHQFDVLRRLADLSPRLGAIPDLIVLLTCRPEVLHQRVQERGQPGEEHFSAEYVSEISDRYGAWANRWELSPVLRVDTEAVDVRSQDGVDDIATEIRRYLSSQAGPGAGSKEST